MSSSTPANEPSAPTTSEPLPDILNPHTFLPPSLTSGPGSSSVIIEFCDRCRWLHRASWVQTELLLTFPPPVITSITLVPRNSEETAGRFRVWVHLGEGEGGGVEGEVEGQERKPHLAWDRKVEGGFPELKVLKQRIRDVIQPGKSLGHSDKKV